MVTNDYHSNIINNLSEIESIAVELSGKVYDVNTNSYVSYREPLLNEKGVVGLKVLLTSLLSKNTLLSNIFDEEDLKTTGRNIATNVLGVLILNSEEWEIKPENKYFIMSIVINYVDTVLRRAYRQGEREFAKATMQTQRNVTETARPPLDVTYSVDDVTRRSNEV